MTLLPLRLGSDGMDQPCEKAPEKAQEKGKD